METDGSKVTAKNTYGGPLLLRTVFGDIETTYQYMYNAHGDVVALLTDGEVVATYYYNSFGNILDQNGEVSNSILYAGYQYDEETGLYYINARMYDPVTARFLQADTYLGNLNDPLSLNLYTYCLNNPHKYTDPSGHIPLLLIGVALLVGAVSAQAEYKRQVREGDNYTNLVSIGVVGVSNTLLCLIPCGKAVSAYKMATAGGSFVLKTFAVQFGKAVGLGVAAGYATDAGIEVARQLATGTKLSNLEYDRINEAGVTGAIAGGAGAIFGAGVEALANTRVGQSVAAKFTQAVSKGRDAIKSGFAKVAGKSGKSSVREMTGLGESRFKLNLQFFASDEAYQGGKNSIRTEVDLYSFGNKNRPRGARAKDFSVDNMSDIVRPEMGNLPQGASNAFDINKAPLSGHYHRLPKGTQLPDGLAVIADGYDVISNSGRFEGHHTIYPTRKMTVEEFNELYLSLPWEYGGVKK